MATITKTWTFDTDAQGWTPQTGGTEILAFQSSLGNPGGCLSNTQTGKNQRGVDSWQLTGTWESIFGIPAGSTVDSILATGDGVQTKCDTYNNGAPSVAGELILNITPLMSGRSYSSADSAWVSQVPTTFNVPVNQASSATIFLFLGATVVTGDKAGATNRLLQDNLVITVSYH